MEYVIVIVRGYEAMIGKNDIDIWFKAMIGIQIFFMFVILCLIIWIFGAEIM